MSVEPLERFIDLARSDSCAFTDLVDFLRRAEDLRAQNRPRRFRGDHERLT